MKQLVLPALVALSLCGCAAMEGSTGMAAGGSKEMKMAFDITDGSPAPLMTKLTVIELTRKQLIDAGMTPRIVLAFRGDASYYTNTNLSLVKEADRADALKIRTQLRNLRGAKGIEAMEQCNVPLASRKLKGNELIQEVKLVPNGWISLVELQQKGYAYIVP